MLAGTLMPEHCNSGHCGEPCRWSHLVSSALANLIVGHNTKVWNAAQPVKDPTTAQLGDDATKF